MKLSRRTAEDRIEERERRYPFYTALDVTLQFLLSVGVLAIAVALLAIILNSNSPQFYTGAAELVRRVFN